MGCLPGVIVAHLAFDGTEGLIPELWAQIW